VRKGGERRARCGEAETGARFIGVGRQWWGGETIGEAMTGGALSRHWLLKGETTGQRRFMGKLKRSWWCIGLAPYGCGRASIGGGRSALGPKADGADFGGIQKNGGGPHEGMGRNRRIKKNGLFKRF
jgi:hypothetical protein